MYKVLAALSVLNAVLAQNVGKLQAEKHPSMGIQLCTASGCKAEKSEVVLDSNWRWTHNNEGYANCYDGNKWVAEYCPDGKACAANCALEGADYEKVYGITTPSD